MFYYKMLNNNLLKGNSSNKTITMDFKVGDIVYTGYKYSNEISTLKMKILKISPKSYTCMDLETLMPCEDSKKLNETIGSRHKYIFKTREECYKFYKFK